MDFYTSIYRNGGRLDLVVWLEVDRPEPNVGFGGAVYIEDLRSERTRRRVNTELTAAEEDRIRNEFYDYVSSGDWY